jgi:glycerophosphoryl diester phosphodiesterase
MMRNEGRITHPLNLAHRGASAYAPQNTLAAFQLAEEMGADGIELDVHLTADGTLVVIHDFTVDDTTDGSGRVEDMNLAELKRLDAGAWFDARFAGQQVPTLDEVVDAVGDEMLLNIELKTAAWHDQKLERAVVDFVHARGIGERVILSSFNPLAMWRIRRLDPALATGIIYSPGLPLPLRRAWLRPMVHPAALHPHHSQVDARYVAWAHARGYRVHTWTVDDAAEMRRLIELEVDAIITNRPDVLRDVMRET